MAEIPPKEAADQMISGGEWETTVYLHTEQDPGGRPPTGRECTRLIEFARPAMLGVRSGGLGHFLENGSLVYVDVGSHIEVSSPEEPTPEGAAQREIDAECYMAETMENVVVDSRGDIKDAAVYKRTYSSGRRLVKTDDGEVYVDGYEGAKSCGKHLNTGLPRRLGQTGIGREHLGPMGLHIATNALILGSGAVFAHDPSGAHARFGLHQRAPFVNQDYSSHTTRARPVVNLRDEPLVPEEQSREWIRHHDINADACLSPWAMRMQYGTNRLVLRLGLAGVGLEEYEPSTATPLFRIFKQTAFDLTHQKKVELWNGTITPLEIQQVLFENCDALRDRYELCDGELWTLDEWKRALEDFERNPKLLYDRTDWVQKYYTLQKYKEKNGIPENNWHHPMLEVIDTDFSLLKPGSRGMKMRNGPWAEWLPATEAGRTLEQRRIPPQDTRAKIRGEVVRQYGALPCNSKCMGCANCGPVPKSLSVGWTTLMAGDFNSTTGADERVIIKMHPFDTDTSVLDAITALKHTRGRPKRQNDEFDLTAWDEPVGETWL